MTATAHGSGGGVAPRRARRRWSYWWFPVGLLVVTLASFALVEALHVSFLVDPSPWLRRPTLVAALVSIGLLTADIAIPVPSSLVMLANGALFGIVGGAAISLAGGLLAFLIGFVLGRRGGPLVDRLFRSDQVERADRMLRRWGPVVIAASRPLPLLAETVAVVAGTSSLAPRRAVPAAAAGLLPVAVVYAVAGSAASSFNRGAAVSVGVMAVAGALWLVSRRWSPFADAPKEAR